MGVERAFELVGKHYTPEVLDPMSIHDPKHIDMNSIMIGYIESTIRNIQLSNWKKPQNKQEPVATIVERVAMLVSNKLEAQFPKDSSKLHFDGEYTTEKEHAHKERYAEFQERVQDATEKITRTTGLIDNIKDPGAPTSSERNKVIRSSKVATASWKKARPWSLDPALRDTLVEALRGLGWQVHLCPGESDTCISQQADPVVVVSTDSDYLFRDVDVLVRKDPRDHSRFTRYNIEEMLSALGLGRNAWKAIGITSGNDYSEKLPGVAISTNYESLSLSIADPDEPVSELMGWYCESYDCDRDRFRNAETVFGENRETFPSDQRYTRGNDVDTKMQDMRNRISLFLKAYWDGRKRRKELVVTEAPSLPPDQDPMSEECTSTSTAVPVSSTQSNPKRYRGYKTFMPWNKFRPKVFTQSNEHQASHPKPSRRRRKKKKDKKRKRAPLFNPSARKQRMDPTEQKAEPSRSNNLQPATVVKNCLKRYATVSLNCGTIPTQLRKGLAGNEVGSEDQRGRVQKEVITVIQEMVRIGTEATICAQQAVSLYIARTMAEFPNLNDADNRRERLKHIGYFHNDQIFGNMFQDFFQWHSNGPRAGRTRSDTPANECARIIIDVYRKFMAENNEEVPKLQTTITSHLTPFLQQAGRQFADTLQMHFHRNISELSERVKEHNSVWAQGEQGRTVLGGIDDKGKSTAHDPISLFWILNTNLPVKHQMTFFPESGFKDLFVTITEESLLTALLRPQDDDDDPNVCMDVFGESKTAKKEAAEHRGDLIYRLFFSKSLSYTRKVSLINPNTNIPSGHGLLDFEDDDEGHGGNDFASGSKEETKQVFQKVIQAAGDGTIKRKYVLTGTINTNGHALHVVASNLSRDAPKPSTFKKPNTTRNKLDNVLTMSTSSGDQNHTIVGIDPGIKNIATCCVLDTTNLEQAKNVTITQGSHAYVTQKYQESLERAKDKAGGIRELESTIQPVQGGESWVQVAHSIEQHILSKRRVHEKLREFYGSDLFKIHEFRRKQAKTATENKAIDRMIAATGWTEDGAVQPCFVVGDGEFGSKSVHHGFVDLLKKKVITT